MNWFGQSPISLHCFFPTAFSRGNLSTNKTPSAVGIDEVASQSRKCLIPHIASTSAFMQFSKSSTNVGEHSSEAETAAALCWKIQPQEYFSKRAFAEICPST